MKVYFAPLEGITGHIFRSTFNSLYGGTDKFFAPFISPCEKYSMTPREKRELSPESNAGIYLVPQLLTCKAVLFNKAIDELQDMGYSEVNLNLGCPSGTVCAKGKGSGFLPNTDELSEFLSDIYNYGAQHNVDISIKTRLGYYEPDEFYDLMEIFNNYPVSELIVHPRIRGDYYKGEPRYEYYRYALDNAKMPLVYNGNIYSSEDYLRLSTLFEKNIDTVMLGRGLISRPSLALELKSGNVSFDYRRFWEFHDVLYSEYSKIMSPDINILYRMKELWTYWRANFEGNDRLFKELLKSRKCSDYERILFCLKRL